MQYKIMNRKNEIHNMKSFRMYVLRKATVCMISQITIEKLTSRRKTTNPLMRNENKPCKMEF